MKRTIKFVRNDQGMEQALRSAKTISCVHCGRTGTLNRHDKLNGNDLRAADKQTMRGRRLWCSNRGKRGGCGRTMSIVYAHILPRCSFTSPILSKLLSALCKGSSVQAAWENENIPLHLQSLYHLLQRFRHRMGAIRSSLLNICDPPECQSTDTLIQTAAHLHCAFSSENCVVEAFQMQIQVPIMG